jgi:hypothetical protein
MFLRRNCIEASLSRQTRGKMGDPPLVHPPELVEKYVIVVKKE